MYIYIYIYSKSVGARRAKRDGEGQPTMGRESGHAAVLHYLMLQYVSCCGVK